MLGKLKLPVVFPLKDCFVFYLGYFTENWERRRSRPPYQPLRVRTREGFSFGQVVRIMFICFFFQFDASLMSSKDYCAFMQIIISGDFLRRGDTVGATAQALARKNGMGRHPVIMHKLMRRIPFPPRHQSRATVNRLLGLIRGNESSGHILEISISNGQSC